jgi:hypothetical protein
MSTPDIVAEWEREKEAQGFRNGRDQGLEEGLANGLNVTAHSTRWSHAPTW